MLKTKTKAIVTTELKKSLLEIQVSAALAGHDLGAFEPVEVLTGGYGASQVPEVQSIGLGRGFRADV